MSSKTALDISPSMLQQYRPFRSDTKKPSVHASIAEAHDVAKTIANELVNRFGAKKVILFGSLVRGEINRWSDIDLAAWGISSDNFYRAVAFATGFSRGWKVDLIDGEDCREALREIILQEGIEL
jgi:predicted nucleotidyltransferase